MIDLKIWCGTLWKELKNSGREFPIRVFRFLVKTEQIWDGLRFSICLFEDVLSVSVTS